MGTSRRFRCWLGLVAWLVVIAPPISQNPLNELVPRAVAEEPRGDVAQPNAHATDSLTTATGADRASRPHAEPDSDYWSLLFVFGLSTLIGMGVIERVSRLLHTPLMSLTNAISAIAVVGAIIVVGGDHPTGIRILGFIALSASMTNIVSGFLITDRMLKMFKQTSKDAKP